MDSLVRMRCLFDTLEPGEQIEAIKRVATASGPQLIMTLVFTYFAKRLHSHAEDQSISTAITKAISSVITDRKTEPKCDDIESPINDESDSEQEPTFIEELPYVMISNVASYLNQRDYIHFMHSSRRILIGCHSPFSLYHLNVYVQKRYSITRCGQRDAVKAVKSLLNRSESNIRRLTIIRHGDNLLQKGSSLDDGDKYLQFISDSARIKCIETPLSIPFPSSKLKLPTMLALKGTDYHFATDCFPEVQRQLIRKHSKQIESLNLVSEHHRDPHMNVTPPNQQLTNLMELKIGRIAGKLNRRQVLFEWIKHSSKLKIFSIDCSRLQSVSNSEVIEFLINNQKDLQFTEFVYDAVNGNVMGFMQQIGNGLSKSTLKQAAKLNEDKEFKIRIRLKGGWMDLKQKQETVTNSLTRILRAHGPLALYKLNEEFESLKSESWKNAFQNDLDIPSFVWNHERFRAERNGIYEPKYAVEEAMNCERELNAVENPERSEKTQKIIDGFGNLVGILKGCNVRHFMVQIVLRLEGCMRISKQQQVEDMEGRIDDLMQKWKGEYRVDIFYAYASKGTLLDDRWRITFCNKDNPMNGGYGAHGLFIE